MVDPTPLGAAVALLPAVATVLSHILLAFENLKQENVMLSHAFGQENFFVRGRNYLDS